MIDITNVGELLNNLTGVPDNARLLLAKNTRFTVGTDRVGLHAVFEEDGNTTSKLIAYLSEDYT